MTRRGLGKGLSALIGEAAGAESQGAVRQVPPWQISMNPYQPRKNFDDERMAELVNSVKEHGILQPLLVRSMSMSPGAYELVAGERRLRAALAAGLQSVPVIVKEYEDTQMLEVALIENVQREDITSVEAALAYRQLIQRFGFTQEAIARRLGKARSTVANTLRLLSLDEPVLQSLSRREISEGHARAILQVPKGHQEQACQEIITHQMDVRTAEKYARNWKAGPAKTLSKSKSDTAAALDPNLAAVESALREALGTKVTVKQSGLVGRIEIEFYDGQQLEGLVQRLSGGL